MNHHPRTRRSSLAAFVALGALALLAGRAGAAGACCFAGADCLVMESADCLTFHGAFQGEGSSCGSVDCPCTADVDGDRQVGLPDVLEVLLNWGPCASPGPCPTDLNGDDETGLVDLLLVLTAFGPC